MCTNQARLERLSAAEASRLLPSYSSHRPYPPLSRTPDYHMNLPGHWTPHYRRVYYISFWLAASSLFSLPNLSLQSVIASVAMFITTLRGLAQCRRRRSIGPD